MKRPPIYSLIASLLFAAVGCGSTTRGLTDGGGVPGCPTGCVSCNQNTGRCNDCEPNVPFCQGDVAVACNADGTIGKTLKSCDTSNNEKCMGGTCQTPCDVAAGTHSYIACDYWPVTLLNAELDARFDFAVAVANPLRSATWSPTPMPTSRSIKRLKWSRRRPSLPVK